MAVSLRPAPYSAMITPITLAQFPRGIQLWDTPRSAVEGAQVIGVVTEPTQVEVMAEQFEPFSSTVERLKIRYQSQEGWMLAIMLTPSVAA